MATISKGYTFGATEEVTNIKLHSLVDSASVTSIINADVGAGAGIVETKLSFDGSTVCTLTGTQTLSGAKTFTTITDATLTNCTLTNDPTFTTKSGLVPVGAILMWSGAVSAIPTGWGICDGSTYGTTVSPDLTDKFVVHADADAAGTNNVGESPDLELGTHTHDRGNHTHNLYSNTSAGGRDTMETVAAGASANTNHIASSGSGQTAAPTGDGTVTTYALAYIIKTDA